MLDEDDLEGWRVRSRRSIRRRTPRLEAGIVLDPRRRPSWPLWKGTRAHDRRMSPASVEIASSQFAMAAARATGAWLDLFSMTYLLSLLRGGVSRTVIVARLTRPRQVRGL